MRILAAMLLIGCRDAIFMGDKIFFLWSSTAYADARNFLCKHTEIDHEAFSFMLIIDVDNKTMTTSISAWADKITVVFEERHIIKCGV